MTAEFWGPEAVGVEASVEVWDCGSVDGVSVAAVEGAGGAVAGGGLEEPAPGRRPAFGLKDKPPVFLSIELMVAIIVHIPKLLLC